MSSIHWNAVELRQVARFASGKTPSRSRQADFFDGGTVPWVKTLDLTNSRIETTHERVTPQAIREARLNIHPAGTVLVAMYGGFNQIGRTGILRMPAATNQAITAILPNKAMLDPDFLLHTLNYRVGHWRTVASSSRKDPNITNADVQAFPLRLPSLAEQNAVGAALNHVTDLIESLARTISKKQAIKQGLAQQLLTGATRLPGFTEPWRQTLLGPHVRYLRTVPLSRAQLDTDSPIRCLHYGDIHTSNRSFLSAASVLMPRAPAWLAGSAGRLQVGDLVFADASEDPAGVGKSVEIASVPAEGLIAGLHTIAARFDRHVLADGFKAYLQLHPAFRRSLLRLAAGTKVLATTRSYISSVELSLPPVDEQRAIARALQDADAEIDALNLLLDKARAIKQGMAQRLLTGEMRLPVLEAAA
jgi:type I restriction enzyme S subunit